jgi:hypothetical protein
MPGTDTLQVASAGCHDHSAFLEKESGLDFSFMSGREGEKKDVPVTSHSASSKNHCTNQGNSFSYLSQCVICLFIESSTQGIIEKSESLQKDLKMVLMSQQEGKS